MTRPRWPFSRVDVSTVESTPATTPPALQVDTRVDVSTPARADTAASLKGVMAWP